jgi:hypothetical protein
LKRVEKEVVIVESDEKETKNWRIIVQLSALLFGWVGALVVYFVARSKKKADAVSLAKQAGVFLFFASIPIVLVEGWLISDGTRGLSGGLIVPGSIELTFLTMLYGYLIKMVPLCGVIYAFLGKSFHYPLVHRWVK